MYWQGGVGIELWTMTEDILFDNIYVGHSLKDAKALATETFEIKKPLEVASDKSVDDDMEEEKLNFKDDPVSFIRTRVVAFVQAVKEDPLGAIKAHPETGAALAGAFFTLFGILGALVGIIGGAQKPVVTKVRFCFDSSSTSAEFYSQSTKKTETPSEKEKEGTPVSSAVQSKEKEGLRNRK